MYQHHHPLPHLHSLGDDDEDDGDDDDVDHRKKVFL